MELGEAREVRTTCPYCGVGCGVLAKVAPPRGERARRAPPPATPKGPATPHRAAPAAHQRPRRRG
ncbi:hypothetical protein, partial [Mesorhizobium sp. M0317]|uniref:hypothetical protein n=1 Tax=Mesorhizobium sp. M0317 TaxID=2956935 RepID=UPI00333A06CA